MSLLFVIHVYVWQFNALSITKYQQVDSRHFTLYQCDGFVSDWDIGRIPRRVEPSNTGHMFDRTFAPCHSWSGTFWDPECSTRCVQTSGTRIRVPSTTPSTSHTAESGNDTGRAYYLGSSNRRGSTCIHCFLHLLVRQVRLQMPPTTAFPLFKKRIFVDLWNRLKLHQHSINKARGW